MDAKALETIKLVGNQILAIREIIDKQQETINSLKKELLAVRQEQVEVTGNVRMVQIDQKDLVKQVKNLKQMQESMSLMHGDGPLPSQDEIARRFYANYDESPHIRRNGSVNFEARPAQFEQIDRTALKYQAVKPNAREHQMRDERYEALRREYMDLEAKKDFVFGRIPKLLNLD
jgi:hypothetical protein